MQSWSHSSLCSCMVHGISSCPVIYPWQTCSWLQQTTSSNLTWLSVITIPSIGLIRRDKMQSPWPFFRFHLFIVFFVKEISDERNWVLVEYAEHQDKLHCYLAVVALNFFWCQSLPFNPINCFAWIHQKSITFFRSLATRSITLWMDYLLPLEGELNLF